MKLDMINLALFKLGEDPVDQVEEADVTPSRARKVLAIYDRVYDEALLRSRAEVIKKRVEITAEAITPDMPGDFAYPFTFRLPAEGLAFDSLPQDRDCEEGVETINGIDVKVVRARTGTPLRCRIIRRVAEGVLTPDLFNAVAEALAAAVAWNLSDSVELEARKRRDADKAMLEVRIRPGQSRDNLPERGDRIGAIRRSGF